MIVRKGELLLPGPPDQPLLNIEAIRNPDATEDDVIAGVRVTGSADQPKAEIFSDPVMSQQEALSYLLRGQGLSSGQSDSAAMTSMLIGMGVAQSGQVVGKIGETFGVSNLALDTEGVGDSSPGGGRRLCTAGSAGKIRGRYLRFPGDADFTLSPDA